MPHAALWVVQQKDRTFCPPAIVFQCRTRLYGWCNLIDSKNLLPWEQGFNAARGYFLSPLPPLRGPPPPLTQGRLGYAPFSRKITQYQLPPPMRGKWRAQRADRGAHAARGFVGGAAICRAIEEVQFCRFNAARGFVGGAAEIFDVIWSEAYGFNAARGFVGGATRKTMNLKNLPCGFNAARGFVGGATYMALCMGMAKDLSFNAARGFVGGAAPSA